MPKMDNNTKKMILQNFQLIDGVLKKIKENEKRKTIIENVNKNYVEARPTMQQAQNTIQLFQKIYQLTQPKNQKLKKKKIKKTDFYQWAQQNVPDMLNDIEQLEDFEKIKEIQQKFLKSKKYNQQKRNGILQDQQKFHQFDPEKLDKLLQQNQNQSKNVDKNNLKKYNNKLLMDLDLQFEIMNQKQKKNNSRQRRTTFHKKVHIQDDEYDKRIRANTQLIQKQAKYKFKKFQEEQKNFQEQLLNLKKNQTVKNKLGLGDQFSLNTQTEYLSSKNSFQNYNIQYIESDKEEEIIETKSLDLIEESQFYDIDKTQIEQIDNLFKIFGKNKIIKEIFDVQETLSQIERMRQKLQQKKPSIITGQLSEHLNCFTFICLVKQKEEFCPFSIEKRNQENLQQIRQEKKQKNLEKNKDLNKYYQNHLKKRSQIVDKQREKISDKKIKEKSQISTKNISNKEIENKIKSKSTQLKNFLKIAKEKTQKQEKQNEQIDKKKESQKQISKKIIEKKSNENLNIINNEQLNKKSSFKKYDKPKSKKKIQWIDNEVFPKNESEQTIKKSSTINKSNSQTQKNKKISQPQIKQISDPFIGKDLQETIKKSLEQQIEQQEQKQPSITKITQQRQKSQKSTQKLQSIHLKPTISSKNNSEIDYFGQTQEGNSYVNQLTYSDLKFTLETSLNQNYDFQKKDESLKEIQEENLSGNNSQSQQITQEINYFDNLSGSIKQEKQIQDSYREFIKNSKIHSKKKLSKVEQAIQNSKRFIIRSSMIKSQNIIPQQLLSSYERIQQEKEIEDNIIIKNLNNPIQYKLQPSEKEIIKRQTLEKIEQFQHIKTSSEQINVEDSFNPYSGQSLPNQDFSHNFSSDQEKSDYIDYLQLIQNQNIFL